MKIAAATQEDVEDVLRIERAVGEAPHWAVAEYAVMVAAHEGTVQRCLLVARDEDGVWGFAVGKVAAGEAELESVAVLPPLRRRGIARALCEAVVAWAWRQGATRVELEVRASSAGAIALYRGLGFVEAGRRRHYYADPVTDAVLMTLARDAGL